MTVGIKIILGEYRFGEIKVRDICLCREAPDKARLG